MVHAPKTWGWSSTVQSPLNIATAFVCQKLKKDWDLPYDFDDFRAPNAVRYVLNGAGTFVEALKVEMPNVQCGTYGNMQSLKFSAAAGPMTHFVEF